MTPSDKPNEAMIKANSPICAIENPHFIAFFSGCPPSMNPIVPKMLCPIRMVSTRQTIGMAYFTSTSGSTSIPTETKNTAPKRFFTGSTSLMILSASIVSARMLPMTNAPKALLNPTAEDITAIMQHKPSDTMTIVSSFINLRVLRRNGGMRNIPMTNHRMRKNPILNTLPSILPPSGLEPLAMALSITIITMASTSSSISTLITMPAKRCWRSPISSNAL